MVGYTGAKGLMRNYSLRVTPSMSPCIVCFSQQKTSCKWKEDLRVTLIRHWMGPRELHGPYLAVEGGFVIFVSNPISKAYRKAAATSLLRHA